jgi:gp16 family phage-associated protein
MGLHRNDVTDLIRNRLKGNFGRAHRAAVALGLKENL